MSMQLNFQLNSAVTIALFDRHLTFIHSYSSHRNIFDVSQTFNNSANFRAQSCLLFHADAELSCSCFAQLKNILRVECSVKILIDIEATADAIDWMCFFTLLKSAFFSRENREKLKVRNSF